MNYSLYLVTNQNENLLNIIEESILGGVSIVQLREKKSNTKDFYQIAKNVKKITDKHNIPLIINDRLDIALAINASGVHLGQDDLPCKIARNILKDKIIGISASTVKEAKKAEKDGANYIGCGAIFPTKTKNDAKNVSINKLKEIVESVNIPVVAIGGINKNNVIKLKNTQISGISVVSEIMDSENPKITSEKLLNSFKNKI